MRGSKAQTTTQLGALLVLTGGWLTSASAGEAPAFTEILDVRVVNLEVAVTRGGQRVTGLAAEDFELRVDGRPISIDYFSEIRGGEVHAPKGYAAVPSLLAGEVVGTRFLVFVDDDFAVPSHRDRVLHALGEELDQLGSEDEMAVVAFDGRRLEALTSWSRSTEELIEALESAQDRTAYGLRRWSELRRLEAPPTASGFNSGSLSSFSSIGYKGAWRAGSEPELQPGGGVRDRIARVASAAASTLRGFAQPGDGFAGRKVMLLLSTGWPALGTTETERLAGHHRRSSFVASPEDRFHVLEPLVETANRLGFTLYPVSLQPQTGIRSRSAEFSSPAASRIALERREILDVDRRDSLFFLADATGGKTFEGAASLEALRLTVEDTRSYYWLGFSPSWRGDGASHRTSVKLLRRGLRTRTRKEFSDLSRAREIDLMLEGAQLFDRPLPGEGLLDAELGRPERAGRQRIRASLRIAVPLDKVMMLPGKEGFQAALELRVAARDEEGALAEIPLVALEISREERPTEGDVAIREVELKLRKRSHRLIVVLYDPATGTLLAKRLEFVI